jgi:TPP-dependent pyruvate/acetoin dehydrogenase alpha subunit
VCHSLAVTDKITSTHRGHGHCIAKGADLGRMMAELYGKAAGYCHGKGGSMHIADFEIGMLGANGIVGAGLPIATGAALAAQLDGRGALAVCFFSDGAVGAGPFHEALNIASSMRLPIVYVCENNGWASATPTERVLTAPPAALAERYGIRVATVDGNDVLAVRDAFARASAGVRAGDGPFLLEAVTFRMSPHAIRSAMPAELRDAETMSDWTSRDPLVKLRTHAETALGSEAPDWVEIEKRVAADIDAAVEFARTSPEPRPEDALEGFLA